jgi:hypothetical protein
MRFLKEAEREPNDYYLLTNELLGIDPATLTVEPLGDYQVNDRMNFTVNENPAAAVVRYKSEPARLRYISEHVAWWTSIDATVGDTEIEALAQRFEDQVHPIDQQLFGKEWSPGIDGDERIHFLIIENEAWGSYFGYFSMSNEYPKAIFPNSNEREMLVINAASSTIDSEKFATMLAHEYQHLIHWNQDPNEDLWLNESFGELVTAAGGSVFGESNEIHFANNPQIQLTSRPERTFGEEDKGAFAHYAAERQFSIYLLEQFGDRFINSVTHNPKPGVLGIDEELVALDTELNFNAVFANWLIANFLDMPEIENGQFGYQSIDTISPIPQVINSASNNTFEGRLLPYGSHYYQINSNEPVRVTFNGSTLTRLAPKDPAEGSYVWYSNRGDNSTFRLTRTFDLSEVDKAR